MKISPKNIVIIFNNLNIGGIETKIIDLCHYYSSQKNVKITLLLKSKSGSLLNQLPSKTTLYSPKITDILKIRTLIFPFWLTIKFNQLHPNLILTFGNYSAISGIVGKYFGHCYAPLIISEDSSITKQLETDTFSFLRTQLVKITYPLASQIIVLSKIGQQKLTKLLPQVKNRISILYNWLPLNISVIKQINKKDIDILFLGRFEPQKNPQKFLEISRSLIKKHPDLKIAIVGYGSLETKIRDYISKNKLNSQISIFPQTTSPAEYFKRSHILLLTSNHEGFPLTLLESTALKALPICINLPEIREYFNYRPNSILYNTKKEAINKIENLLKNPPLLKQLAIYYQQKTLANQKQYFTKTIKFFNQYL
ncbi:MAG: glycosyltransferase [Candidatus Shapirobacteria bacterium]